MSFDTAAATAAYLASLPPEAVQRSDAYFQGGYWLLLWDWAVSLAIAWLLLRGRLSLRMRALAERCARGPKLQAAIYAIQYLIVTTILALPWSAYEGWYREHQYGLTNQALGSWLGDQAKALMLIVLFGTLVVVAIYALMRRAPRSWWLWGALTVARPQRSSGEGSSSAEEAICSGRTKRSRGTSTSTPA